MNGTNSITAAVLNWILFLWLNANKWATFEPCFSFFLFRLPTVKNYSDHVSHIAFICVRWRREKFLVYFRLFSYAKPSSLRNRIGFFCVWLWVNLLKINANVFLVPWNHRGVQNNWDLKGVSALTSSAKQFHYSDSAKSSPRLVRWTFRSISCSSIIILG